MVEQTFAGRWRAWQMVGGYGEIELGHYLDEAAARDADREITSAEPDTCAGFGDRWPEDFPRSAEASNRANAYGIRRFVAAFGDRPLDEVTRQQARAFALAHPSPARFARIMYEDAITVGMAHDNPFAGLRIPQRRAPLVIPSAEEVTAMAAAFELVGAAAYTGLRLGELLALRPSDISGEELLVERQVDPRGRERPPKNRRSRVVALLGEARRYLHPPYNPDRNQVYRLFHEARPRPFPFHSLRHYHATWLLDLGATPQDVAIQLGHTDGGHLVQVRYGHPDDALARDRLRVVTQ